MGITLLALSDWCRLFAFKTGNPYSFFTSVSYWWLTEHDERNMSCAVNHYGDWEYEPCWGEDRWAWSKQVDPNEPDEGPAMY